MTTQAGDTSKVELQIDSNNDGAIDASPGGKDERLEDDATQPGKLVPGGWGDADDDGIPDWRDGFDYDPDDSDDDTSPGLKFVPLVLEVREGVSFDPATTSFAFFYDNSRPSNIKVGTAGQPEPSPGQFRIWSEDGDAARDARTDYIGTYYESGAYTAAQLGLSASAGRRTVTLYLEGVEGPPDVVLHTITVRMVRQGESLSAAKLTDTVRATAGPILIAVDGDNTGAIDDTGQERAASRPTPNDQHEYTQPGKIVIVNDGDMDNDGVPDYAAGWRTAAGGKPLVIDGVGGNRLTPVRIELPAGVDPSRATVKFSYAASRQGNLARMGSGTWSDPWVYGLTTNGAGQDGSLRLWRKDGTEARSFLDDFIYPDTEIEASSLFPTQGSGGARVVTLYVEAVRPSTALADLPITVRIDPDGAAGPLGFVFRDTIRMTTIDLTIAFDDRMAAAKLNGALNDQTVRSHLELRQYVDTTTAARPFPFWLNDDFDNTDSLRKSADGLAAEDEPISNGARVKDNLDGNGISTTRDLEDFLSFQITASLLSKLGPEYGLTLSFPFQDISTSQYPTVRVFQDADGAMGSGYLYDPTTARSTRESANANPIGLVSTNFITSVSLPNKAFHDGDTQQYLLEGINAGRGALSIQLVKRRGDDLTVLGKDKAYIEIRDVRERYDHFTVGDTNTPGVPIDPLHRAPIEPPLPIDTAVASLQPPVRQFGLGAAWVGAAIADGEQDPAPDYILFVHGWRMTPDERLRYAETSYKRLFWEGYRGDFGLFSWPTEYIDTNLWTLGSLQVTTNYYRSEQQAWNSAPRLQQLLGQLYTSHPGRVNVFAHSMGNVVVSEALRLEVETGVPRHLVHTYIATQAATVADAYADVPDLLPFPDSNWDTPNVYAHDPATGQPYFASIGGAADKLINFYNPGDWALSVFSWQLNHA